MVEIVGFWWVDSVGEGWVGIGEEDFAWHKDMVWCRILGMWEASPSFLVMRMAKIIKKYGWRKQRQRFGAVGCTEVEEIRRSPA